MPRQRLGGRASDAPTRILADVTTAIAVTVTAFMLSQRYQVEHVARSSTA